MPPVIVNVAETSKVLDDAVEDETHTVPENEVYKLSPLLATVVVEPVIGLSVLVPQEVGVLPAACDPLEVPFAIGVPLTLALVEVKF